MNMEKSIFISYRRSTSKYLARLIYNALSQHEYDVFFDVSTLDNGQFDTVILNQIAARPHFIVILSPGAFVRCVNPDGTDNQQDWLRIEIERAMDLKRNIVPIIEEGFSFETERAYLTGKLSELPRYNAVKLVHEYFDPAMQMLQTRFLKARVENIAITPTPATEHTAVEEKKAAIEQDDPAAAVQRIVNAINGRSVPPAASLWNRAQAEAQFQLIANTSAETIEKLTQILKLNPRHDEAYNNRGVERSRKGDKDGAIADYTEAIRLNPHHALAYNNRGIARSDKGDKDGAIADYTEAIRLNPQNAIAYYNRGTVYHNQGKWDKAIAEYEVALRINPNYILAKKNLQIALDKKRQGK